ncbi:MAG: S8 family serine peptidase [Salinivirgaceae bacterium]|jgi:subtilisin family serine protease|nr:S8 family serine peptidase [Salinivirgaceae bacterium]
MKIYSLFIFIAIISSVNLYGNKHDNKNDGTTIDSLNSTNLNWYNLDIKENKVVGASVQKAYFELLKDATPQKKIVVAVIDGGVDIYHEDLQGKIWINSNEIAENGIDDDNNGFIDDIHGWNFLGNSKGENINVENMEYVRIINTYKELYDSVPDISKLTSDELSDYTMYTMCKKNYEEELNKYEKQKESYAKFQERLSESIELLKPYTKSSNPKLDDLAKVNTSSKEEANALKFLEKLFKRGFTYSMLHNLLERNEQYLTKHLNLDLNARSIINDNIEDYNDAKYGNNDMKGTRADHGSFVAGIIAANRNNEIGIDGIAENVEIMVLRAVPDGDEFDKYVALSIK